MLGLFITIVVATIVLCSSVDMKQGYTTECRLIP